MNLEEAKKLPNPNRDVIYSILFFFFITLYVFYVDSQNIVLHDRLNILGILCVMVASMMFGRGLFWKRRVDAFNYKSSKKIEYHKNISDDLSIFPNIRDTDEEKLINQDELNAWKEILNRVTFFYKSDKPFYIACVFLFLGTFFQIISIHMKY